MGRESRGRSDRRHIDVPSKISSPTAVDRRQAFLRDLL